jgi:hypothetical protein
MMGGGKQKEGRTRDADTTRQTRMILRKGIVEIEPASMLYIIESSH